MFAETRALSLPWKPFFSFAFRAHNHINLLEIESVLSLLRHLAAEGRWNCRVLALTGSRIALGTLSKGRSISRRVNHLLKKVAALYLCYGFQFDVVWVPTWGNTTDAPSENGPSPPGTTHFRSCPPPDCGLSMQKTSSVSSQNLSARVHACPLHHCSPLASSSSPACSLAVALAIPAAFSVWPEPRYVQPALSSRLPTVDSSTWVPELLKSCGDVKKIPG